MGYPEYDSETGYLLCERHKTILMHKILNNRTSNYLRSLLTPRMNTHCSRGPENKLSLLMSRTDYLKRSLSHSGTSLSNSLLYNWWTLPYTVIWQNWEQCELRYTSLYEHNQRKPKAKSYGRIIACTRPTEILTKQHYQFLMENVVTSGDKESQWRTKHTSSYLDKQFIASRNYFA